MAFTPSYEYFLDRQLFHGSVPLVMGTKLECLIVGLDRGRSLAVWEELCAEVKRLDALLNRFDPASEVSRLNAAADCGEIYPAPAVLELIRLCEAYRIRTGGLFDITRGTCGEGLQLSGDGSVSLNGGSLDFGGFAKGYFLRECRELLTRAGVRTAYVDFGGSSILALGHHPFGESWRIRVTHPYSGAVLQDVDLQDQSLSTSGNRPGYSGHILDPRTGRAVEARRIVTVVAPDPLDAEIVSTAAMIADEAELASLKAEIPVSEVCRYGIS